MATSNCDIERKISRLRAEILSYKPGKATPCDDKRVVFPDKLVIGVFQLMTVSSFLSRACRVKMFDIVSNLRRALHGDVEERSSTETLDPFMPEETLTYSISVMTETCSIGHLPICAVDMFDGTGKVSQEHYRNIFKKQGVTGIYGVPMDGRSLSDQERFELLSLLHRCLVEGDIKLGYDLKNLYKNVTFQQIYETEVERVTEARREIRMRREESKILQQKYDDLKTKLHDVSSIRDTLVKDNGSLQNELKDVNEKKEQTEKEMTETANRARHMEEKYKQIKIKYEVGLADNSKKVEEMKLLKQENSELETKLHDVSSSHDSLLNDNESLKDELKGVREKEDLTEVAMADITNSAKRIEQMYKKSDLKYENELKISKLREVELIKREEEMKLLNEEKNDLQTKLHDVSSSHDSLINENASLKNELTDVQKRERQTQEEIADIKSKGKRMEEMYKKNENELRSTKLRVDALMETMKEAEETAKQEIEGLKNEREEDRARFEEKELEMKKKIGSKELNIEQLERETWKLRTKIQLESEIRSAEQKKEAKKSQWLKSFIPWIASGKQAQTGTSETNESSEDKSSTSDRDDLPSREDPPNDAFGDILKQIADDLYDENKIDSLGGQLGILQGDIERALMTNVKFDRVTSKGTLHMLQQWRRGVSREDERGELRRALLAAKLVDLADRYAPEETGASTEDVQSKEAKDGPPIGGKDDMPVAQGDLSSGTNEGTTIEHTSLRIDTFSETNEDETTVDQALLHIDPSTNTNEDTTSTIDQAPLQVDPSSETYKDISTTDQAPLHVDPTVETNEEIAHGSMNIQESGDLSKPITTEVHHEPEDEGCPTSVVAGDITTGYQDLICHLASNETSSDKLLIIFFVNVLLNIRHSAFGL